MDEEYEEDIIDSRYHDKIKLRQYQIELINIAKKQNSIIFLPTGSGKTFIAIKVLQSKSKDLKQIPGKQNKIAIFLGTTKPLVKQLAEIIKENTPLKVKYFIGDMGIDNWSRSMWLKELSEYQVFCMVPAVLLTLITTKIVSLKDIALLVLDECHRCVAKHPYTAIIKEFDFIPEEQRPLILGLTATVLNSNASGTLTELEELQRNMKCVFAKTSYLVEAIKYATAPVEEFIQYENNEKTNVHQRVLKILTDAFDCMSSVKILSVLEKKAEEIMPKHCQLLCNKNLVAREIKNMFKNLENVVKNLGLFAASLGCLYYIIRLERLKFTNNNPVAVTVTKYGITILNLVRRIIFRYVPFVGPIDIKKISSKKVNTLIDLLDKYEKEEINCLILVEEKITAVVLSSLLNRLSANCKKKIYQSNFITGGLFNTVFDTDETAEENKRQKQVLESFRKKEFSILIGTSVIEEGIDIPACNVVVKFDALNDYRNYIQCKGRSRFKYSHLYIFHTREEFETVAKKVRNYNALHQKLLKLLHSNEEFELPQKGSSSEDEEEYFFVDGPNSEHVSGTSSIGIVYRYCSRLPQDSHSFLAPLCWYDAEAGKAYLQLPSASSVLGVIEGDKRGNRKAAKKNVFLKAVIKLYEAGEILKDLTFRSYVCHEEDHEELFPHYKKEPLDPSLPQAGTKSRRRTYSIQNSESLVECFPHTHLHIIKISPTFPRPVSSRLGVFYDVYSHSNTFAMLSNKKASKICDFPLFLNIGTFNCSLIVNSEALVLTTYDIERIQKFHCFIFNTLLGVVDRLQVFDNEKTAFYIVPVKYEAENYVINWNVVNQVIMLSEEEKLSEMITPDPSIEDYSCSIIYPKYRRSSFLIRYYIVTSLDRNQNPLSKFPSDNFDNYYDYYSTKYGVEILDKSQPLLEVKPVPEKLNYLKPRKLIHKNRRKYEEEESFQEFLVPELCCRHLFPADVWLKATILPSALYRIMTISRINDFRKKIAEGVNIGVVEVDDSFPWLPLEVENSNIDNDEMEIETKWNYNGKRPPTMMKDDSSKIQLPIDLFRKMEECAPCDLKHYLSYFGLLSGESTDKVSSTQEIPKSPTSLKNDMPVPVLPILANNISNRGPELRDFVKVFTCKSSNDIVDLERLEFFGDSLLKFAAVLYVFRNFNDNEGILVGMKDKIVGNRNFLYCAEAKHLQEALIVNEFEPKSEWCAPGFCLPEEVKKLAGENSDSFRIDYGFQIPYKEKITGKLSPETVKSLQEVIGVKNKSSTYTLNEFHFSRKTIPDKSVSDCVEALVGLYGKDSGLMGCFKIINWLDILPSRNGSYEELIVKPYTLNIDIQSIGNDQLSEVLYDVLEGIIGYEFKNKVLLLQALTHPSYVGGQMPSYQRLEFLGDAIIDVLITMFIHYYCPNSSPGAMTDLRSALVNNITLACIAVKYDLHKFILHRSATLTNAITDFVMSRKESDHKIDSSLIWGHNEEGEKTGASVDVPKALGDIFESIFGAIFLDCNNSLESVWNILYRFMKDAIDSFIENPPKSPIRILYESCKPLPQFTFQMAGNGSVLGLCKIVYNEKERTFTGRGKNRQNAKLSAAKNALAFLNSKEEEFS